MADRRNRRLQRGGWTTRRDVDLEAHQVQPGAELRDGMLDLQPRVDLQEVEPRCVAAALQQELRGTRISVSGSPARCGTAASRIFARRFASRPGDEELSLTIFWWRRCREHSRSWRANTRPRASPMSWTSMCRGRDTRTDRTITPLKSGRPRDPPQRHPTPTQRPHPRSTGHRTGLAPRTPDRRPGRPQTTTDRRPHRPRRPHPPGSHRPLPTRDHHPTGRHRNDQGPAHPDHRGSGGDDAPRPTHDLTCTQSARQTPKEAVPRLRAPSVRWPGSWPRSPRPRSRSRDRGRRVCPRL